MKKQRNSLARLKQDFDKATYSNFRIAHPKKRRGASFLQSPGQMPGAAEVILNGHL
ncbi:MAG: hypothetical protein MI975_16760 [Cytophagales bacterium]|nr:hypothetical protein [Cytophagales bacterium]